MTHDELDDFTDLDGLLAEAAGVEDADFRTPAVRAAFKAAMEDLTHMQQTPDRPAPDETTTADLSYISTEPNGRTQRSRRMLAAAAVVALLVVGAAGVAYTRAGGEPDPRTDIGSAPETTTVPETTTSVAETQDGDDLVNEECEQGLDELKEKYPEGAAAFPDLHCSPPPPSDDGRTPPDPADAPPANAPLEERIHFAYRVAYYSNIEHTIDVNGGSKTEWWTDEATGTMRMLQYGEEGTLNHEPYLDQGPAEFDGKTPTGKRHVDHCFSRYDETPEYGDTDTVTTPSVFKRDVADGSLVVDGSETLDGRETIRMHRSDRTEVTWLDATTLLPIKTEWSSSQGGGDYVTTYEFLPRAANLSVLVPPVPAGFTKDGPTGDAIAAGCFTDPGQR